MDRLKRVLTVGMFFFLFFAPAPVPAAAETGQVKGKADAAQLMKLADRAMGHLVKTARESNDPALAPGSKAGKPFWQSLKKLNGAVDKAGRGLYLKGQTFFRSLGDAVGAVNQASVTLDMSGARDAKVKSALNKVRDAVMLLDERFGKAAARKAKGGGLTAREKQHLAKMRANQEVLQQKLKRVEKKVGRNGKAIRGIQQIREKSDRIRQSRDNTGDYLAALVTLQVVDGLLWGWHWWWGPWGAWVEPFSSGYVDVYYASVDMMEYDWAVAEIATDIYDYDLYVDISAAEMEYADTYIETTDFVVTEAELTEIAVDEAVTDSEIIDDRIDAFDSDDFD